MADDLAGLTIAILAADGVEQIELEAPREAVQRAGAGTVLLSIDDGEIQAMHADVDKGDMIKVDRKVADAGVDEFDGLLLPGGTCNPDNLRMDGDAVNFVRNFVNSGKPVGVICHGPWTLVEADVVRGRTLTSYPSLRTDHLDVFVATVVEEFARGRRGGATVG